MAGDSSLREEVLKELVEPQGASLLLIIRSEMDGKKNWTKA